MTPDTFAFPTGEHAFIYLGRHNTRWITGNATRKDGELYQFMEQGFQMQAEAHTVGSLLGARRVGECSLCGCFSSSLMPHG